MNHLGKINQSPSSYATEGPMHLITPLLLAAAFVVTLPSAAAQSSGSGSLGSLNGCVLRDRDRHAVVIATSNYKGLTFAGVTKDAEVVHAVTSRVSSSILMANRSKADLIKTIADSYERARRSRNPCGAELLLYYTGVGVRTRRGEGRSRDFGLALAGKDITGNAADQDIVDDSVLTLPEIATAIQRRATDRVQLAFVFDAGFFYEEDDRYSLVLPNTEDSIFLFADGPTTNAQDAVDGLPGSALAKALSLNLLEDWKNWREVLDATASSVVDLVGDRQRPIIFDALHIGDRQLTGDRGRSTSSEAALSRRDWPSQVEQPRVALVVGNSRYQLPGAALSNPANDARLIAEVLKDQGFQVTTLIDANKAEMESAIGVFGQSLTELGRNTVGLFYFAGHGLQIGGVNFLVPVDAHPREQNDMALQGVRLDTIMRHMGAAENSVNFILLDACRNNPLPRGSADGDGLAATSRQDRVLISYATAPGQVAADGAEQNSPYTQSLSYYLKRDLVAELMLKRVAAQVVYASGGAQLPWYESGLIAKSEGEDFYFTRYRGNN